MSNFRCFSVPGHEGFIEPEDGESVEQLYCDNISLPDAPKPKKCRKIAAYSGQNTHFSLFSEKNLLWKEMAAHLEMGGVRCQHFSAENNTFYFIWASGKKVN